jgi:hypothetical protein
MLKLFDKYFSYPHFVSHTNVPRTTFSDRTVLPTSTKNRSEKGFQSEEIYQPTRRGTYWVCNKPYDVQNSLVGYVAVCRVAFH